MVLSHFPAMTKACSKADRESGRWLARHLGLPFAHAGRGEAVDCWGLVVRIYGTELGIDLESYAGQYVCGGERETIARLFDASEAWPWRRVESDEARAFDVALFTVGAFPAHVGVFVDSKHMIHIERGRESVVVALDERPWAHRLSGIFRHEDCSA